ncbi:DUF6093 family protein [Streptomyces sp. NPDC002795]|uniref:DUF6093 family protein n=1 Tax=Streptomyces sp. NPDC002795 TaxID=3364665 RepID=UPI0036B12480
MALDLEQARAALEAELVDTVRITRTAGQAALDPDTGEPGKTPTTVVYEGPGAVLSTHGQIVMAQLLGTDWLSEGSSWYRLVAPVSASVALPGDLVEVVTGTAGLTGREWVAEDATEASTVEICRTTRLTERITAAPVGV